MEVLTNCPLCNSRSLKESLTCIDYTVTKEEFKISTCISCGLLFTNPRPEPSNIGMYYESDDYISHSNTEKGIINKIYHQAKKIALRRKSSLVTQFSGNKRKILDIGCGTGDFLAFMKNKGWESDGIEPNEKAREAAKKNHGIDVQEESALRTLPMGNYSVITMWHVLEHVYNLRDRLDEIKKLLQSGGHAIIAVPNHTSWDAQHYGSVWAGYDVPRHLYHFSPLVIKNLFQQCGFEHVQSFPMKMDAYYVSMLSEKYLRSAAGVIKAAFIGFRSNFKAKNDAEKYSSVIYVFRKN